MKNRTPTRRFPVYAVLAVAILATAALAQTGVANRSVQKRINTMIAANTAVDTLAKMMGGNLRFDRRRARDARRTLIAVTRSIPSEFRKRQSDPLSRASPVIWTQWGDFKSRARTAKDTAQALDASRMAALRATLPDMIRACQDCHRSYRSGP